jgi:hypothetical protein
MYDVHVQTLLRTMRHDETFLLLASIQHHTTAHSASFLLLDYRYLVPVEKSSLVFGSVTVDTICAVPQ